MACLAAAAAGLEVEACASGDNLPLPGLPGSSKYMGGTGGKGKSWAQGQRPSPVLTLNEPLSMFISHLENGERYWVGGMRMD